MVHKLSVFLLALGMFGAISSCAWSAYCVYAEAPLVLGLLGAVLSMLLIIASILVAEFSSSDNVTWHDG